MRPSATSLAVGLLLSVALPIGLAAASDPGEQSMLAQANFWRTQHQFDRAADQAGVSSAHSEFSKAQNDLGQYGDIGHSIVST